MRQDHNDYCNKSTEKHLTLMILSINMETNKLVFSEKGL